MNYLFNENGQDIEIPLERWAWGVIYQDGTELKQFGDDGRFHRLAEIDQDKVAMAVLYNTADQSKRVDLPWRPGMKLIHKYINFHSELWVDIKRVERIYVFGYKAGENVQHYTYILPDDRMIISPQENIDLTLFNI